MKKLIVLLVAAAVIGMAYFTAQVILTPMKFEKIMESRNSVLQKQLKTIADAEKAYEELNGRYATMDELKDFLRNGKVYHINAEGDYTDDMRDKGLTEQDAVAKGLIKRDTVWSPAKDKLLAEGQDIDELFKVLKTGQEFKIDTASKIQVIGMDSIRIPLFQATVEYKTYLSGIDESSLEAKISKENDKKNGFPGLRIGSLTEAKMTGNWE